MASNCGHSRNTLCGLLLAIVAGGATTPVMAFQDEGTVRVGVLESLTGTYAPFGLANMSGTVIAFDEINAAGGVTIDGKKVKIAVTPSPNGYDAGVDPAQSVTLLKRLLLDDKVLLIKGLSNSNAGTAVFNYLAELEKEGNPIVVHSSSVGTPGLTKLSNYAFRNSFVENADVIGNLISAVVKDTGAKSAVGAEARLQDRQPVVDRRAEHRFLFIQAAAHAQVLRPAAGKHENEARVFELQGVREDAPGVTLLEQADRLLAVGAGEHPALLETAPTDAQRVRDIGQRLLRVLAQPLRQALALLIQRLAIARGQHQQLRRIVSP